MSQQAPAAPAKQVKWASILSLFMLLISTMFFACGVIGAAVAGAFTLTAILLLAGSVWGMLFTIVLAIYGTQE